MASKEAIEAVAVIVWIHNFRIANVCGNKSCKDGKCRNVDLAAIIDAAADAKYARLVELADAFMEHELNDSEGHCLFCGLCYTHEEGCKLLMFRAELARLKGESA